jgi:hypothetical protein
VSTLTFILTRFFDLLLAPFGDHRTAGLVALSVLMGACLTLLYRATSDARRIRRSRDIFKARVLEMRLYPDDFVLITRALFGALAAQGLYLRAAAKPILIVALVAIPFYFQIEGRYAHAPLAPGARTLVTARLKDGLDVRAVPTRLAVTGEGAVVDSRSVRAAASRDVTWRVQVSDAGTHEAVLSAYDQVYRFPLRAAANNRAIGTERNAHSFIGSISDIGLPEIGKDSALDRVTVTYPDASYRLLGMTMSWLVAFLLATLVGAMVPALLLRVAL